MATVNTQQIGLTATAVTYSAATAGGDKFRPDTRTVLHLRNGAAAPITATVVTPGTGVAGLAIADLTVTVPAGAERFVGPFPEVFFAGTGGLADITWSAVTTVTFAALAA